jgi:hypothetical protein
MPDWAAAGSMAWMTGDLQRQALRAAGSVDRPALTCW